MNYPRLLTGVSALYLSLFVQACDEAFVVDPERPSSVPQTAVWYGGLDGGNWSNCLERNSSLECDVYWQNGDLYSRQSFELCRSLNPSEWALAIIGEGISDVSVAEGIVWTPTGPAIYFDSDGKMDEELSEKSANEFELTKFERCSSK